MTKCVQQNCQICRYHADEFFQAPNRPTPKLVSAGALPQAPRLLVGWGGDTPLHTLPPRRLRRLVLGVSTVPRFVTPNTNSWLRLSGLCARRPMDDSS